MADRDPGGQPEPRLEAVGGWRLQQSRTWRGELPLRAHPGGIPGTRWALTHPRSPTSHQERGLARVTELGGLRGQTEEPTPHPSPSPAPICPQQALPMAASHFPASPCWSLRSRPCPQLWVSLESPCILHQVLV